MRPTGQGSWLCDPQGPQVKSSIRTTFKAARRSSPSGGVRSADWAATSHRGGHRSATSPWIDGLPIGRCNRRELFADQPAAADATGVSDRQPPDRSSRSASRRTMVMLESPLLVVPMICWITRIGLESYSARRLGLNVAARAAVAVVAADRSTPLNRRVRVAASSRARPALQPCPESVRGGWATRRRATPRVSRGAAGGTAVACRRLSGQPRRRHHRRPSSLASAGAP
jgi:hypothetical protein